MSNWRERIRAEYYGALFLLGIIIALLTIPIWLPYCIIRELLK